MRILKEAYETYKDDLQIEDTPEVVSLDFKEGDIVELNGNIYLYLWKKTVYGYLGLLATPYTILAHPVHPRIKTDGLLYEEFAIIDEYIPLTEETIENYLTDVIEVKADKEYLEKAIEKAIETKKIYHPVRIKFLENEIKRTNFLIKEFFKQVLDGDTEKGKIVISKPLITELATEVRLAASTEQQTAENEDLTIVKTEKGKYTLLIKQSDLKGKNITLLFNCKPIFEGVLDNNILTLETKEDISPTVLAKYLKLKK